MRSFRRESAFNAIVNLFTSFGYFKDPADDRRVAGNMFANLKPGGRLIMELMSKEILARIFLPSSTSIIGERIVVEEHHIKKAWGWIDNQWTLIKDGKARKFRLSHRLYSAVELTGLLADVGFTAFEVYGDFNRRPYDHTARRLVVVAHKK
jgi:SAM-dependent methyltransferase